MSLSFTQVKKQGQCIVIEACWDTCQTIVLYTCWGIGQDIVVEAFWQTCWGIIINACRDGLEINKFVSIFIILILTNLVLSLWIKGVKRNYFQQISPSGGKEGVEVAWVGGWGHVKLLQGRSCMSYFWLFNICTNMVWLRKNSLTNYIWCTYKIAFWIAPSNKELSNYVAWLKNVKKFSLLSSLKSILFVSKD